MRIGYVATDEVNHALAARMAAKCGAIICHLRPREVHPDGLFDAVLYDLDDVPETSSQLFLRNSASARQTAPRRSTAMVSPMSRPRPCRHGVAVAERLHPALLRSLYTAGLCKAARRSRATVPSDGALTDLTWFNLAK